MHSTFMYSDTEGFTKRNDKSSYHCRYLSTGLSFEALAGTFFMDSFTISRIVREVCDSIYEVFWSSHMPIPTPQTFLRIAEEYETLWQFPLCVGQLLNNSLYIRDSCCSQ